MRCRSVERHRPRKDKTHNPSHSPWYLCLALLGASSLVSASSFFCFTLPPVILATSYACCHRVNPREKAMALTPVAVCHIHRRRGFWRDMVPRARPDPTTGFGERLISEGLGRLREEHWWIYGYRDTAGAGLRPGTRRARPSGNSRNVPKGGWGTAGHTTPTGISASLSLSAPLAGSVPSPHILHGIDVLMGG